MKKVIPLLLLVAISFVCFRVPAVQASSPTGMATTGRAFQVVPLPPPTPTSTTNDTIMARLNEPFTLHLNEWATLQDTPEAFSVQLASFVSDNRCPARVACVVSGQVEFMLRFRTGNVTNPQAFHIGTYPTNDQNKVRYGGYEVELTDVQPPAPPPDEQLKPSAYEATLVVRVDGTTPPPTATPAPQDEPASDQPQVNQPFTLHIRESATVAGADLKLTLRSVTPDSGCLSEDDCSLMLAEGTLVMQQGDKREVLDFNVSFTPEQPFDYEFAGYTVALVHIEKTHNGEHVATFVVKKRTPMVVIPAAQKVERCPQISRFDAAALLQEEVQPKAIANLVFAPLPPDVVQVAGLCGYVTTAFQDARQIDEEAPYLASQVAADRAVVVATVPGSDVTQLLQLARLIAADTADNDPLLALQAKLTAGFYEDLISDLATLAESNPSFTVTAMQGRGNEGIWLWQTQNDGYFALLITRSGQSFQVVVALLNAEADESTVLAYATLLAERLE